MSEYTSPKDETFHWGAYIWDIAAAQHLLTAKPRPVVSLSVAAAMKLIGMIRINEGHAIGRDLREPLIVVPFLGSWMVIDGWHRLWRADREGTSHLPAYPLSVAEERKVRLHGGRIHRR